MSITARTRVVQTLLVFLTLVAPADLRAQQGSMVQGILVDTLTGAPVAGAAVVLDELGRETTSADDGTFTFEAVPAGSYHLSVKAPGYSSRRTELAVPIATMPVAIPVDPQVHFQDVVSVSPGARSQFESYQPTTVLAGQDLAQQLGASLGATLENQPGVSSRSFGPAPSRPVIRGLDGDRVLILQDGQRVGDLSSQSGDHGVSVNPAAAQTIEVVRGPATLLYGANAIGGLVNVITDEIPTTPQEGFGGNVTFDLGSAANEAGTAADIHAGNGTIALHAGGGARRSGAFATPEGEVANSQTRSGFGNVGLSWTRERAYVGASYGYDDTKYGIPVVEEGSLQLTPRRHSVSVRAGGQGLSGVFDGFRATLGIRRYKHDELEGDEIGTSFRNDTTELELMGSHRAAGRLQGSVGAWVLDRAFDAQGAEALSPSVGQRGFAAFVYEELSWPHVTFQFGGRIDRTAFEPRGEPNRDFTNVSGSIGLLVQPPAANDSLTIALSAARAARNPALEELFFFGLHHGNFAIELGNPDLESERAFGFDASLRWRSSRASGEITYFRNDIGDFIFRRILDEEEFEAREEEFQARFPGRELVGHDHDEGEGEHEEGDHADEEFAIVEFLGADTVLQGLEAHADLQLTGFLTGELGVDYVRASLEDTGDPLPRIPPFRFRGGLRYRANAFQAGAEVMATAAQNRVSGAETVTGGHTLLKLFTSYSFQRGQAVNTITARVDNVANTLYRNHLSLIKHVVPEMGRNMKVLYRVQF
jgi:iron complex outermembrane receptor protein